MKEFKKVNKTFIKSNNTTNKIFNRYLYCLIPFILLITIYNLTLGSKSLAVSLVKSIIISIITTILTQAIFNIIKNKTNKEKEHNKSIEENLKYNTIKEKEILHNQNKLSSILNKIFLENQTLTIAIILGFFSINASIPVTIISAIITIIIKNIFSHKTFSSTLYGLLIILVVKQFQNTLDTPLTNLANLLYTDTFENVVLPYGSILKYILGLTPYYLSPILSIMSFIYLFHKKSIKYNIVFSYILTISFVMLVFGIFNNMNIWYLLFQLTTGNLLFLSVFCLTDYPDTPTTEEGQLIYGIILGLLTSILRFIIPELSVVIPLILGPILLTNLINKISFKLRYNKKYYYTLVSLTIICVIITTIILNIVI